MIFNSLRVIRKADRATYPTEFYEQVYLGVV